MSSRPARFLGALLAAPALLLTGCSATIALEPAQDASNVSCAAVSVRLPDVVADQPERETNAQATAAWGDPASILLHCGVEVPGPTTLPCVEVNGVDWIRDDSQSEQEIYTFTTFGRDPAVQITVDQKVASGSSALVDLAGAVSEIPTVGACTDVSDAQTLDTTSTPAP